MENNKKEKTWFKLYPEGFPKTLDYPNKRLDSPLEETANETPGKTALVFFDKKINYRELNKLSNQFACALQEKGIKKGDRVLFLLPNCPQVIIGFYGALKIGAIPIPLNPLYTARELKYFFKDAEPRIVVTLDKFYDKAKEAEEVTPQIEQLVVTNIADYFPTVKKILGKLMRKIETFDWDKGVSFKDFLSSDEDYNKVDINTKKDTAVMIYTGGTTGKPKGVMLTHFNIMSNAFALVDNWIKKIEMTSALMIVPFFHIYGINVVLNWMVKRKGKIVLVPKFNTKETIDLIQKYNIDYLPGVPAIYSAIWKYYQDHPEIEPFKSVKLCASGTTSISSYLWEKLGTMTPNSYVVEGYGLSETSPLLLVDPITSKYKKEVGAVGIPIFDTKIKIVNPDTEEECEVGEAGEILAKGPQVFKGYWKKEDKTEEVFTEEGWFRTGDVGRKNEKGIFFIEGRLDNMINVRGEKVWPREVEKVLEDHPKIREVAVVGVQDNYYGQTIKAFVSLREGDPPSEKDIIAYCKDKLISYKVPQMVEFINELPKSKMRKIQHHKLREKE